MLNFTVSIMSKCHVFIEQKCFNEKCIVNKNVLMRNVMVIDSFLFNQVQVATMPLEIQIQSLCLNSPLNNSKKHCVITKTAVITLVWKDQTQMTPKK